MEWEAIQIAGQGEKERMRNGLCVQNAINVVVRVGVSVSRVGVNPPTHPSVRRIGLKGLGGVYFQCGGIGSQPQLKYKAR